MAEYFREDLLRLADAAKIIPSHPHTSTLWRWCLKGVKGVRLQTLVVGGRRYTTMTYLTEFIAHLSASRTTEPIAESSQRTTQKEVAARRAKATFG
jgi:Protein of unknown function (DUF1580)